MIDYYLKFTDKEQADTVLYTKVASSFNKEGEATEWMDKPNYDNIDVIGTIYKSTGEVEIVDEMKVPVMVALDGYHVNVRHNTESIELDAYAVTPTNPKRTWAGD